MRLKKLAFLSLYLSIGLLFPIFVLLGSFQPLYYVLWVLGVGGYVYRHQGSLRERLTLWKVAPFKKYLALALGVILVEETFASTAMHLMRYLGEGSWTTFFRDVSQFWAFNLLALPGMLIGWYFLVKNYAYTKREIFMLAGLFGIFSEKIITHILDYPLIGWLLIVPTIFTYGLIISIPMLSMDYSKGKRSNLFVRYAFGFITPLIFSMPFIAVLMHLHKTIPALFPPAGFVG